MIHDLFNSSTQSNLSLLLRGYLSYAPNTNTNRTPVKHVIIKKFQLLLDETYVPCEFPMTGTITDPTPPHHQ